MEKPKQKAANKTKKKAVVKDSGFEDVVFKTPPLTPPPPAAPPEPLVPAKKVEKDDAFWEFYNKPR